MSDEGFPTVAEIGPPFAGMIPDDWLFGGTFDNTLTDQANLHAICVRVNSQFGPGASQVVSEGTKNTRTHRLHLLFRPDPNLMAVIRDALDAIECGQRVCDETWEDFSDAEIALQWHAMHIADRLDLAEEAQVSAAFVLLKEPCEEIHTLLYRELE